MEPGRSGAVRGACKWSGAYGREDSGGYVPGHVRELFGSPACLAARVAASIQRAPSLRGSGRLLGISTACSCARPRPYNELEAAACDLSEKALMVRRNAPLAVGSAARAVPHADQVLAVEGLV